MSHDSDDVTCAIDFSDDASASFCPQSFPSNAVVTTSTTTCTAGSGNSSTTQTSSAAATAFSSSSAPALNNNNNNSIVDSPVFKQAVIRTPASNSKWIRTGRKLGSGAFGSVDLAYHISDTEKKRPVAIKTASQSASRELTRECLLLAQLPPDYNTVQVLDVEVLDSGVQLVMECAQGGSLLDLLALPENSKGLSEEQVAVIAVQLLSGVSFLHRLGIAHRDIKPANCLLAADGTMKIADFGLTGSAVAEAVGVQGTLAFLSPEAIEGNADVGMVADIWAVSCTLCQLATNLSPWARVRAAAANHTMASQYWELRKLYKGSTREELISRQKSELLPSSFSEAGQHFLLLLLEPDPALRPAASAALAHGWLSQFERSRQMLATVAKYAAKRVETCLQTARETKSAISYISLARLLPWCKASEFHALADDNERKKYTVVIYKHEYQRAGLLQKACISDRGNDLVWFVCGTDPSTRAQWNPRTRCSVAQEMLQCCCEIKPDDAHYWLTLGQLASWKVFIRPRTLDAETGEAVLGEPVEMNQRLCFVRALEAPGGASIAAAWHALGTQLCAWNPMKRLKVQGVDYSYRECLVRAAEIIEEQAKTAQLSTITHSNYHQQQQQQQQHQAAAATANSGTARAATSAMSSTSSSTNTLASSQTFGASFFQDIEVWRASSSNCVEFNNNTPSSCSMESAASSSSTIMGSRSGTAAGAADSVFSIATATAVVTSTAPVNFYSRLGRALPLRSHIVRWEQRRVELDRIDAEKRAVTEKEYAARGKKAPPPPLRRRPERLANVSRTGCLLKACALANDDMSLFFDLAISLHHDRLVLDPAATTSDSGDAGVAASNRRSIEKSIATAIGRGVGAALAQAAMAESLLLQEEKQQQQQQQQQQTQTKMAATKTNNSAEAADSTSFAYSSSNAASSTSTRDINCMVANGKIRQKEPKHFALMGWLVAARLMQRFEVDNIAVEMFSKTSGTTTEFSYLDCIQQAKAAAQKMPDPDSVAANHAWLERMLLLNQQQQPQQQQRRQPPCLENGDPPAAAPASGNNVDDDEDEKDEEEKRKGVSFVVRNLKAHFGRGVFPKRLRLPPQFLGSGGNNGLGIELTFINPRGVMRVSGSETYNSSPLQIYHWHLSIVQRFFLVPATREQLKRALSAVRDDDKNRCASNVAADSLLRDDATMNLDNIFTIQYAGTKSSIPCVVTARETFEALMLQNLAGEISALPLSQKSPSPNKTSASSSSSSVSSLKQQRQKRKSRETDTNGDDKDCEEDDGGAEDDDAPSSSAASSSVHKHNAERMPDLMSLYGGTESEGSILSRQLFRVFVDGEMKKNEWGMRSCQCVITDLTATRVVGVMAPPDSAELFPSMFPSLHCPATVINITLPDRDARRENRECTSSSAASPSSPTSGGGKNNNGSNSKKRMEQQQNRNKRMNKGKNDTTSALLFGDDD